MSGPIYDTIAKEVSAARSRLHKQRSIFAASAFLVVLFIGLFIRGAWKATIAQQFSRWNDYRQSELGRLDSNANERVRLAEQILLNRWALTDAQVDEIEACILIDHQVALKYAEKQAWAVLDQRYHDQDGRDVGGQDRIATLNSLLRSMEEFEKQFAGDKTIGVDVGQRIDAVQEWLALESSELETFQGAEAASTNASTDARAQVDVWNHYLSQEHSPYYMRLAETQLGRCKRSSDANVLASLASRIGKTPNTIEQCGAFLDDITKAIDQCYDKQDAMRVCREHEARLLKDADRLAYEIAVTAVERARRSLKGRDFWLARDALADYVLSPEVTPSAYRRQVRKKAEAQHVLDWFKSVMDKPGKVFPVTLVSLFVPKGHFLFNNSIPTRTDGFSLSAAGDWTYTAQPTVYYTAPASTTNESDGARVDLDSLMRALPPKDYRYVLGSSDLRLTVYRYGFAYKMYDLAAVIEKDTYIPGRLSEGIAVADKNGKELILKVTCEGAEVPKLSPYE